MNKLKGLILTDGMHGMLSQAEGLAKALGLDFFHEKIELNSFWNIIPPKLSPVSKFVFKNNIKNDFDVIISCGRKSVIPSIYYKKKINKKTVNIHIQNPKVSLKNFDFIVAPDHDNLHGSNVIVSKGAIHYITLEDIQNSKGYLENKIDKKRDIITLILGGPTKYYSYSEENIIKIFSQINKNLNKYNLQLIVIPSNRTPKNIINFAKEYFHENRLVIENIDKKAYLSSLALAKYIVVTCDSSSMISEAATTGKPVYVAMLAPLKNDQRFKKFRDLFKKLNIIKELNENLEIWNYEKLDETARIAKEIKKKII